MKAARSEHVGRTATRWNLWRLRPGPSDKYRYVPPRSLREGHRADKPNRLLRSVSGFGRLRWVRFDWALIAGLALLDLFLARRMGMRFFGWQGYGLKLTVPVVVAIYYRISGRSDRLAEIGYYVTTWLAFSIAGCILTYLAARSDLPLRDVQFAHYDSLLGFSWYEWASFVSSHQRFELLLALLYSTILPQTIGSVIYFAHIRRPDRNDDLLHTTMLAALITTAISALAPALGPHLKGQHIEWSATLAAIRHGTILSFSLDGLDGIIAFPSFHTVTAILLTYAHRPPVRSFWIIFALNLAMLLSIPSEGQHYLVDMISGAVVAAISIAAIRISNRARLGEFICSERYLPN